MRRREVCSVGGVRGEGVTRGEGGSQTCGEVNRRHGVGIGIKRERGARAEGRGRRRGGGGGGRRKRRMRRRGGGRSGGRDVAEGERVEKEGERGEAGVRKKRGRGEGRERKEEGGKERRRK